MTVTVRSSLEVFVVHLTPADQDKLLLAMAGLIARERRDRGVALNYPEAVALLSCWVIERARDGASVERLMRDGRAVLARSELMEGVPEMLAEVQVEATFADGRKLVTIHNPVP
jgi:urease subunit gamma